MKNANWIGLIAVAGTPLLGAIDGLAQDWPQWRGPNRDGRVTGFAAPKTWPKEFAQKWQVTLGAGDATPALVAHKLGVFTRQDDEEVIQCVAADTGKVLWQDKYRAQAVTGAASRHPGPRSSPVVAEGKVVTLGVGGVVSCWDATTGKLQWRKEEFAGVVPRFFTGSSPLITEGLCLAQLGGSEKGGVVAYDLANGQVKWQWLGDGPAYASPVVATLAGRKQVVAQTEKNLVGLAVADGKLLWQIPCPTQGRFYNSATPMVDGDTVIYTGQGKGTRAVKIEKQAEAFAVKELWHNPTLGTGFNTPVLKDGLLFGLSDRGSLFCLNTKTGETAWTEAGTRRENFGAVLDAGTVILALPSSGELIVLKPDAKEYTEWARIKVAESPTYAHPVVSGNRIFVKDRESVTLWALQ